MVAAITMTNRPPKTIKARKVMREFLAAPESSIGIRPERMREGLGLVVVFGGGRRRRRLEGGGRRRRRRKRRQRATTYCRQYPPSSMNMM